MNHFPPTPPARPRRSSGMLIGIGVAVGLGAAALIGIGVLLGRSGDEGSGESGTSAASATASSERASSEPPLRPSASTGAPSTSVVATSATALPTTTLAVPTTATGTSVSPTPELMDAEPFRRSYASVSELPPLPVEVAGHVPFLGVQQDTVRVFDGSTGFTTSSAFSTQMNRCGDAFWVARWTVTNPDVRVLASNEVDGILGGEQQEVEEWLLPPAAPAGMLGGSICTMPGFVFAGTVNGNESNLVDVVLEWQYFDRDYFVDDPTSPSTGASGPACAEYAYDDELPIAVCAQGFSVELLQAALGLDVDGFFGPGTEQAVRGFQSQAGLPETGVVDAATWSALGVTANAPYPDYNGDGVVDGSEFPAG